MKKNIQKSRSFKEMENTQLQYFTKLEPEMILHQHKLLVLAVYGLKEEPLLKNMPHIINFNLKK